MCVDGFFSWSKKSEKKKKKRSRESSGETYQIYTEDAKKRAIMKLKTPIFKHLSFTKCII